MGIRMAPIQDESMSNLGLDLVAVNVGPTARRLATTITPTASAPMSQTGTTETGTTPKLLAKRSHVTLPATKPIGTPIRIPTNAKVVACQLTAQMTWLLTNPSTLRSPVSLRRRET